MWCYAFVIPPLLHEVIADRDALLVLASIDALSQEHGPVISVSKAGIGGLQGLLDEMCEAWQQPAMAGHSFILKGNCLRALALLQGDDELGPLLMAQATTGLGHLSAADRIAPALSILEDRRLLLGNTWRVAELAEACGISQAQFHRCFKRITGQTPRRYIAGLRIVHATELLVQPDLSLAEVSRRCGFSTVARFHAAFVREHGVRPGCVA